MNEANVFAWMGIRRGMAEAIIALCWALGTAGAGAQEAPELEFEPELTLPPIATTSIGPSSLATDRAGVWGVAWVDGGRRLRASQSTDHGENWTDGRDFALDVMAGSETLANSSVELAASDAGTWMAVWARADGGQVGTGKIFGARSRGGVLDFGASVEIGDGGGDTLPSIAHAGGERWVAVWHSNGGTAAGEAPGPDPDILYAYSEDDGRSWSPPQPLDAALAAASETGFDLVARVAASAGGTAIAVWQTNEHPAGRDGFDFDIYHARSTDGGATWGAASPIQNNSGFDAGTDAMPAISTDGEGNWVAVWWSDDTLGGTIGSDGDLLFVRSTDDGATWSDVEPLNHDARFDTADDFSMDPSASPFVVNRRPAVAAGGGGQWAVIWSSIPRGTLFAASFDDAASWTPSQRISASHETVESEISANGAGLWMALWHTGIRHRRQLRIAIGDSRGPRPPVFPLGRLDFTRILDDGGRWMGRTLLGEGATEALEGGGLCMTVPGPGDNLIGWVGPERMIDLVDSSMYRVRVETLTGQTAQGAIPLWSLSHDNFTPSLGLGNSFGGESFVLDGAGGANGIGRPQGRTSFDFYITPPAVSAPQWRGSLDDGTSGAFSPEADAFNDMRLVFKILDFGSAGINADADLGTICIQEIEVARIPTENLVVDAAVFDAPIGSAVFAPATFGQTPLEARIDDALGRATYRLAEDDRATLIPADSPVTRPGLYPVIWESDALYRVTARIAAPEGESDPIDVIMLVADTATNELIQNSWTTRGAPGNMHLAGSPRRIETAGDAQTYTMFFYSQNATASLIENNNRMRAMVDLFNTPAIGPDGAGSDRLDVLGLKIERLRPIE